MFQICNYVFDSSRRNQYGWPQFLDHETGKIRCIQTDADGSDQDVPWDLV